MTIDFTKNKHYNELDILKALRVLWGGKVAVVCSTLIFSIGAFFVTFIISDVYRAEAIVAPVEEDNSDALIPSRLGIAASFAGISLSNSNSRVQNSLAIMQSREFIGEFIDKHDLSILLLASYWDEETNQNKIDPKLYDISSQEWRDGQAPDRSVEWEAYNAFKEILTISTNAENGLITVAIEWTDPVQAAQWVNWLIEEINFRTKTADLEEAKDAISYLTSQISSTQLVDMQRVFYQLIESQTRVVMLADIREEYIFQYIDRAIPPEERVFPRRGMTSLLFALIGFCLSSFLVLVANRSDFLVESKV